MNNKPLELQITVYNPNTQRIMRSVVYPVAPARRIEILATGRLDMAGKINRRIVLLLTDKKGSLENWLSANVPESEF